MEEVQNEVEEVPQETTPKEKEKERDSKSSNTKESVPQEIAAGMVPPRTSNGLPEDMAVPGTSKGSQSVPKETKNLEGESEEIEACPPDSEFLHANPIKDCEWMHWWDSVPVEILVNIVDKLPDEDFEQVGTVSKKWSKAVFIVTCRKLAEVKSKITKNLEISRGRLSALMSYAKPENLDDQIIAATKFSFYQILDSEYRILKALIITKSSEDFDYLSFKVYAMITEFKSLLHKPDECDWKLRAKNISAAVERLRSLNSRIIDTFFWKIWDLKKEPLGMIIFKLMNISVPAKYEVTLSHELKPKTRNAKCHLSGLYEIVDESNSLSSPPTDIQTCDKEKGARLLACYICSTIRWGNVFHTLRLRWVYIDRSTRSGARPDSSQGLSQWPLLEAGGIPPLENYKKELVSDEVVELRNGEKKVRKIFRKGGNEMTGPPVNWLGIKCNLQLWCPLRTEPLGFVDKATFEKAWSELPSADSCQMPYLFKLEFKSCVRAKKHRSQGIVESAIWVEENLDCLDISQTTNLINTPL